MQKYLLFRQCLLLFIAVGVSLAVFSIQPAHAEYFKNLDQVCTSGAFPCPTKGQSAQASATDLVESIAKYVKVIMGAVAVAVIVVAGVKLVMNDGNEEVLDKQMNTLTYAIIGLFLIGLADDISQIFTVDKGGFLKDPNTAVQTSRYFGKTVQIIITFIKYVIGALAAYTITSSGLRMVLIGSNDEEMTKDKKKIGWGLAGLGIVLFANPIINNVLFKIDTNKFPGVETVRPAIDRMALLKEVAGVTNIMASFAGPLALLSLVAGAVMYTFAAGDEEKTGKAKKIITWSLIGIVVMYGAFAIVSLFVTREFNGL